MRGQDVWLPLGLLLALAVSIPLFEAITPAAATPAGLLVPWVLTLTLPLLVRRRWPAAVAVVVCAAFVLGQVAGFAEQLISQAAAMVALYSSGAHEPNRRRAAAAGVVVALLVSAWLVVGLVQRHGDPPGPDSPAGGYPANTYTIDSYSVVVVLTIASTALTLTAAMALGQMAWVAQQRQQALLARSAELRAERDRVAAQAVVLERMSIARELHDVVAHHVSLMGVQASVARRLLRSDPDRSETALGEVEAAARGAVSELGALVQALRTETSSALDPRTNSPAASSSVRFEVGPPASTLTLGQVPDLVEAARAAGTDVVLRSSGDFTAPTPVVGYAIYRLVQEALTNVRKHTGTGTRVQVSITVGVRTVEVLVLDDGADTRSGAATTKTTATSEVTKVTAATKRTGPRTRTNAAGMGLVGMLERITAAGGRVSAGPTPDGFAVEAVFPLTKGAR